MLHRILAASTIALLGADALAQSITPATTPRAHWLLTPGVTGTPTQRRDQPGAASNDKMYVFGGYSGNSSTTVFNALYEFNGTAWTVKTTEGAAGSPVARGRSAIAWDFARDKLVVFGGDNGGASPALLGDTWEWDPTTNAWTDVTPAGVSPSPRRWATMAWEPTTGGMLLFGGDTQITPTNATNDTWLYLGGTWTQLSPTTSPPVRRFHSMMTRSDFGDVFLCAGLDSSTTPQTLRLDTWRFDGSDWINIIPTTPAIPATANANQAVYDPIRKRVVMVGGQGIGVVDAATYPTYGGSPSSWTSEFDCLTNEWLLYGPASFGTADPVIGRTSRYFAAFVPALGKIYKVSGQNSSGTGTITGTCEYQATPVAAATALGAGCIGAAGLVTMAPVAPNDRPWLGRTYDYAVNGLDPTSVAFGAVGFSTVGLPISSFTSLGVPGCMLEISFDVSFPMTNSGGTAAGSFVIPVDSGLIGLTLYQQALQFEFNPSFTLTGISSSNALVWTFGAL